MNKKAYLFRPLLGTFILIFLLTGCMYPDDLRRSNQASPRESIVLVQAAIDNFYEQTGVLPIKNFSMDAPLYERYIVDFDRLVRMNYLSTIPSIAFENGGTHYFVLVHVEEQPTVKLFDIVTVQTVGRIENEVKSFVSSNKRLPLGEALTNGWYRLDYEALGIDEKPVRSVFSGQNTGLLIHQSGLIAVDYAFDLMQLIQREQLNVSDETESLNDYLIDYSYFVPVYAPTYGWENDRPVALSPDHS